MVVAYDPNKSERCLRERGFDFDFAARIFEGRWLKLPGKEKDGEDRWMAIGQVEGFPITLIYTMRGEETRIISAHKSNKKERRLYAKEDA